MPIRNKTMHFHVFGAKSFVKIWNLKCSVTKFYLTLLHNVFGKKQYNINILPRAYLANPSSGLNVYNLLSGLMYMLVLGWKTYNIL